jgi:hypothetical protein
MNRNFLFKHDVGRPQLATGKQQRAGIPTILYDPCPRARIDALSEVEWVKNIV